MSMALTTRHGRMGIALPIEFLLWTGNHIKLHEKKRRESMCAKELALIPLTRTRTEGGLESFRTLQLLRCLRHPQSECLILELRYKNATTANTAAMKVLTSLQRAHTRAPPRPSPPGADDPARLPLHPVADLDPINLTHSNGF
jgi:hypothetical protein